MISTILRGASVALLAVAATTAPAYADKLVIKDGVGDVFKLESTSDNLTPAGTQPNVDGIKTTIVHKGDRIVVKEKFASIVANGDGVYTGYQLRTDEGVKVDVGATGSAGRRKVEADLSSAKNGKGIPCKGLKARMNTDTRTLTITLPRTCVSNPRWVQVAPYSVAVNIAADVVHADDLNSATLTEKPHFSKKVRVN